MAPTALPPSAPPALPPMVMIKSVHCNKYLSLTDDTDKSLPAGFVKFEGENVLSPLARFVLDPPQSTELAMDGYLKHVRCCCNNKYLVKDEKSPYIVLQAEKPQEDTSKISCTLFKVEKDKSNYAIRHVQSGKFACFSSSETHSPLFGGMHLGPESPDGHPLNNYILLDWDNVVKFPKGVRFKGDNGKYISHSHNLKKLGFFESIGYGNRSASGREVHWPVENYQEFAEDTWNDKSEYEVTMVGDGYVRIRSLANGRFWRLMEDGWIWAESSDWSSNDRNTLFWPTINDNKVTLQSMGNQKFCKRLWRKGKNDALNAGTPTMEEIARFLVEESVFSRKIYDVQFDLLHKRVYNERIVHVTNTIVTNSGSQPSQEWADMEYKNIKTTTWKTSTSSQLVKEAELKFPEIPKIDLGVKLTTTENTAKEWVETESNESKVRGGWYVTVPPRTKMVVTMIATRATCDIPYCYVQSDVLTRGGREIHTVFDGVYTLHDYFNQHYEINGEEKLPM